jgi:hypothetical protein
MADNKNDPQHVNKELPAQATDEEVDEKTLIQTGHSNYHGIDTEAMHLGADEVYEKKIAIMNEAIIDLGMGSFQWKIFAMTGFGWFVDNVLQSLSSSRGLELILSSSGCRRSLSSVPPSGMSSMSSVSHSSL